MLVDIIIMLSSCPYGYIFRVGKPIAPGTLGQEKACNVEHVRVPALLPPHPSNLDHPW